MTAEHQANDNYACSTCKAVFRTAFQRCPLDGNPLQPLVGDPLSGTSFADRYIIEECVGEGGMGRVYRARHQRMSRLFAIKVLFGDHAADTKMQARLAREAEAASRLSHPNVISVLDFGETDAGLLYLVMDYVDGPTLAHLIDRKAPMSSDRVVKLARDMTRGLVHAHKRNLIHRDFKADNVIISGDGDEETAKIVDFGIAFLNEPSKSRKLTTEGMVLGTPAVMAPEQAVGDAVDERTDLFSLGVVLYEMLSGHLPFDGSPLEIARHNLSSKAPRISQRVPGLAVDPGLEALSLQLMAKRPEDRLPSAKAVLQRLSEIEGENSQQFRRTEGQFRGAAGFEGSTDLMEPHDATASSSFATPASENGSTPGAVAQRTVEPLALTDVAPQLAIRRRSRLPWLAAGLAVAAVIATAALLNQSRGTSSVDETPATSTSAFESAADQGDQGVANHDAAPRTDASGRNDRVADTAPPPTAETTDAEGGPGTRARLRKERARAERRAQARKERARIAAERKKKESELAKAEFARAEKNKTTQASTDGARDAAPLGADPEQSTISVAAFNRKFRTVHKLVDRAEKKNPTGASLAASLFSAAQAAYAKAQTDTRTRREANTSLNRARRAARTALNAVN